LNRRGQGQQRNAPLPAKPFNNSCSASKTSATARWQSANCSSLAALLPNQYLGRGRATAITLIIIIISSSNIQLACQQHFSDVMMSMRFGNFYFPACQLQRQRLLSCATVFMIISRNFIVFSLLPAFSCMSFGNGRGTSSSSSDICGVVDCAHRQQTSLSLRFGQMRGQLPTVQHQPF
jgi:hypothetical protein